MPLGPGARLGSYEVLGRLGAGGMGEVYRARDTRLARDVALKLLPDSFTHDEERVARFRREAQVLAALNHPHIGSIYGLEETAGQRFLVLELIDGETLAARTARGPLPVEEALAIARQIAEALEAAHEKGIVHRDLKPANIALTRDDRVKVLDFGLARTQGTASGTGIDLTNSPTLASPVTLTGMGVILGTAAYMSPEQAKGRVADKRSDVWAFGCVLYEMLTGKRAFEGDDVSEILAAVLKSPPDFATLPPSLPPSVRVLLAGCLEKDARQRISDISTALFVLRHPQALTPIAPVTAPRNRWRWAPFAALLVLAVAGATIGGALWSRQAPAMTRRVARFVIEVPDGRELSLARTAVAISPDGEQLVYAAGGRLFLRSLSSFESRAIPGADGGIHPVFSPDGQSVLFWSDDELKRVATAGGVPVTVCETAPAPFGVNWGEDGIVFVEPSRSIVRVSPNGGTPTILVGLSPAEGLAQAGQVLPDGDTVLFTLARSALPSSTFWDKAEIVVHSLATGRRKTLIRGGSDARYVPTGHLVYTVEGTVMAVPFDLAKLAVTGGAVPVVEGVGRAAAGAGGQAQFAISASGNLVYVPGPARSGRDDLFLFDRKGNAQPLSLPPGSYLFPRVSPEGKRLAVETTDGKEAAISLYELSGGSSVRRLTFGGNNRFPIWAPDGRRVAYQSDRDGAPAIFWQPVDGGPAERLTTPEPGTSHVPESWSPRGDVFLFSVRKGSSASLWTFSVHDRKAAPFGDVVSEVFPTDAVFSPDGRWVAYQSGEAGSGEATTFVQPYPPTGAKFQIARGGRPLWSPDGKELFYIPAPSQFMAVSVKTDSTFTFSQPVAVTRRFGLAPPASPRPYDMLRDGRIVAVATAGQGGGGATELRVVVNWFDELKAKVPVR